MMYLLDANVISDLSRGRFRSGIDRKMKAHEHEICTSSLTVHELRYGLARLTASKRKQALRDFVENVVMVLPVVNYDARAANWHAHERARLEAKGLTLPFIDSQIAAIAQVNSLTLITRNRRDFAMFAGLEVESW